MRTENKDKELNHRHFIGLRLTDVELDLLDQGAAFPGQVQFHLFAFLFCYLMYLVIVSVTSSMLIGLEIWSFMPESRDS